MADISQVELLNGDVYNIRDSLLTGIVPVIGTQTSSTELWTGNIDVPALYDGLTIAYFLPYDGNEEATLNLTLSDGTSTGAIAIYLNGDVRITTQYSAGSTVILTYWSAGSVSIAGQATTVARWVATEAANAASVQSINGQTGAVNLLIPSNASDVGAIATPSSANTGDFLVYNGSAWVAQTLSTWQGGSY